ncbi:LysR family transcriptional regulator [Paenibacillus dokdonensis]|uniref:LysR family transcriptional regulator n=1 Tax=Paenibacillus dokdonensis TaxID=2567944 RepID=UPI001FE80724|nr:LysR family transcriptional regulator [Paenibacillus dokdonensis]
MSINLHAMMLFYHVALTGSVTEASKRLNISQPAISAQIRSFEKQYNVILFEKKGRNLVLTTFGQKLFKPTEKLFNLADQIEVMIEDYHNHPRGKLRITGNYLATSVLIPKWASLFKQKYPEVEVEISTVNSQHALDRLMNYEADIAIFGNGEITNPNTQSLHCIELYRDEFKFVVAPSHKYANKQISIEEMMKEPFIMREEGSITRKRLFELCKINDVSAPKIELQFNGLNETIQAVIAGYGVSFVSSLIASQYIQRGELAVVDVIGVRFTNKIVLCSRDKNSLEGFIRDFILIAQKDKTIEENVSH